MVAKYQVYKDVAGKFRFRLRAENNKIVAVSEAYEQHASCINGVKSVQTNCNSEIEDTTIEGSRISNPKYQVLYDVKCGYRFHLNARNGEIIAASEGYKTKDGCLNGIRAVQASCNAEIEDLSITQTPAAVETKMGAAAGTVETATPTIGTVETKVEAAPGAIAMGAAAGTVGTAMPSVGTIETKLELNKLPETVTKGEVVFFKGKLSRSDTGAGIANAKISIREHDRSFLMDEILEVGYTKEDGSFELGWKSRSVDFWDDTGEIYAQYDGDKKAKHIRTSIQTIVIK